MEKKNMWKRLLSVTLSVCMIVGLITVTEPSKAEASDGTNILANGDFSSADSAWVDQNGTSVPAQREVDKVTITEYLVNGDFEDTTTNSWLKGTITPGAGYDGTAGLVYNPSTEGAETYYVVNGLDTTGEITYNVKLRIKTVNAEGYIISYFSTANNGGWNNVKWLNGNKDWTEYTTTFTTTSGMYRIGIESTASGTIYIDDVSISTESTELDVATVDVVENGDFEDSTTNKWKTGTITSGAGYNGTAGLVYNPSSEGAETYYVVNGLDTTGEITYNVKMRIKTVNAEGYIVSYFSTANSGGWTNVKWLAPNKDWTEYTTTFTTTSGMYRIGIESTASGTIYIDDLTITYETQAVDETDVVANGDFENATNMKWKKGTITAGAGYNETAGLVYTPGTEGTETYYELSGLDTTGTVTYTMKIRVKTDGAAGQIVSRYSTDKDGGWNMVANISATTSWTEYTTTFRTTQGKYRIGMESGAKSGTIYIDDLRITYETPAMKKTYTEGIGTCKNAETDNVLVMKDYTKVTQPVTITSGATYSYSFAVKGVNTGGNFTASVIAGNETVQTITATSEWTTVEGEFTATADAANFGFVRSGEGELWIDDAVLIPLSTEPMPADHTSLEGPYIPDGHINLLSGAATDFSSSGHGHTVPVGATAQNGYLKTPIKSDYMQFGGMSTVAGQEYTFSCYIWTEGTGYKLQMYEAGVGSASGSDWEWLTYSCGKDTNGWVKVEYSFTAKGTGSVNIGFQETWGGEVTLYVDDVALTTAELGPSDHTVQGGAYIPAGHINLLSGAATDFSSSGHGHTVPAGATVQNGYLKTPIKSDYIQFGGMSTVAGQEYTFSCYIWTEGTGYKLQMYEAGVGSASGSNWEFLEYSCGKDTNGWVKVEYSFTAKGTGSVHIGFQETWGGEVTLYVDDLALTTEAAGEAEDITLTYEHGSSNFHYEQEYRLYIKSTGTAREDLTGTLKINGTEVTIKYEHHEGSVVLLFNGKLSETDVNTVVIPAGTTLYNGSTAVYNIANTFTIYTQKVADGQWMTWLSEYDYQGSDVMYYDMGTAGTKYVFNNVTGITYQGVLKVTGKVDFVLGGTTNSSEDVTALGDYEVSRTVKGEKYDYTVALYKRGDADKTQDGVLTAKDLVASKRAVSAAPTEFGYARYKAADSNTDGVVNEEDAAFMRYILVNDEYDITTTTSKGYSTLGQGVMPIVGSGGPDNHNTTTNTDLVKRNDLNAAYENDFLTDKIFGLVADLGFNTFINQVNEVGNDYETSTRMLKLAEKYNMGVYINNGYISGADTVESQLVPQTAKYDSFASFYGYYVADEPRNASAISNYTTQLNALKNHVNIASYFNMSPLGDSSFNGNTDTYKAYLQATLATGAESLQYDMYLRGKYQLLVGSEIKTTEFYKNLDIARSLSMNASKPFQAWVQTGANWIDNTTIDRVNNSNRLTVQEMYLEANAALAMGAKGINYFTLLESTKQVNNGDNDSGLITVSGEANHNEGGNYDYYNAAKKINTYIAAVDEVLMNATSKGIISDNSTVTSSVSCEVSNYGSVQSITGTEYMVGCFDYYGKDAYLIVNIMPDEGNGGTSQNITLNFDGTYSYTATNMACTKTTASGQSANFTVGAGEAVLVVVE